MNSFKETSLDSIWIAALEKQGILIPTPIQAQCIDPGLAGKDIIGEAQTGTGKTLAFLLPLFQNIDVEAQGVQALVIVPTRELAIQITEEAKKLAVFKPLRILSAYGGQDIVSQVKKLKGNIHLVIATPGRLLDHLRRETVTLKTLKHLVLDEVDQMLHLGFQIDVELVLKHLPQAYQCLFFSATLSTQVRRLAAKYTDEPFHVRVEPEKMSLTNIKQAVIETTDRKKQDDLMRLLEKEHPFMALVFCRTKRRVTALFEAMELKGFSCAELHGDLPQSKREKTLKAFRNLEIQYLIATDVAARGLDIEGITHVINYDVPEEPESYIHRIGRTGRAGQKGHSFTLFVPKNRAELKAIEQLLGHELPKEVYSSPSHDEEETHRPTHREKQNRAGAATGSYKDRKDASIEKARKFGEKKFVGRNSKAPVGKRGRTDKSK
jgi:superfamily II DNA/RNA helicase